MDMATKRRRRLSPSLIIILGFLGAVTIGTLLLMLPISSRSGNMTSVSDAAFTAVSSVCVTGLVVRDTATYWSYFGQAVILVLIQLGGLGVVTVAASFSLAAGRKISLMTRSTMQSAISAPQMGGIVKLTKFVIRGTLIVETIGAIALIPGFVSKYGAAGIWKAVFHSVSAFCNAGFDIMGASTGEFSSLTGFSGNAAVTVPIMLLIVIGGIGFITWDDVRTHRFHLSKYRMQSKVVLTVTAMLILVPASILFFRDYRALPFGERLLSSLFQSVTPRTAGFNTTDLTKLSGSSKAMMTGLMLIGGSPGSTAGGMKTTTIALIAANVIATFKKRNDICFFKRRVDCAAVKNAATIFTMYLVLFVFCGAAISMIEGLPIGECFFETASALGTVGLSLGITAKLSLISKLILMLLMFTGRVGGLTLVYAFLPSNGKVGSKYPLESITAG